MTKDELKTTIKSKYEQLLPYLNQKTVRIWAAVESISLGRGGISLVSEATELSRTTIHAGVDEIERDAKKTTSEEGSASERIRNPGGGRKRLTEKDIWLTEDLKAILEESTLGNPEKPLFWTSKSTTKIANELNLKGHKISQRTVCSLLDEMGYSLQMNKKTKEGASHPDRDGQFRHISSQVIEFQKIGQPVISVDAKKKELIGEFKNNGSEWQEKGKPVEVNTYDFVDKELGKVAPYGVYDISANKGWVNVGIDHDTAEFAVESIRRWWYNMGKMMYPDATEILITADGGGSNGSRVRLWKYALQRFADEINCTIQVSHFPPGTSKWNKIEHRMFCYISQNWRGRPLISREVVVNLISNTSTKNGLEIRSVLDLSKYETGIKISDEQFEKINLQKLDYHGDWNYRISKSF